MEGVSGNPRTPPNTVPDYNHWRLGTGMLKFLYFKLKYINYVCKPLQGRGGGSSWTLVRQIKHWSGKIAKEAQISILK